MHDSSCNTVGLIGFKKLRTERYGRSLLVKIAKCGFKLLPAILCPDWFCSRQHNIGGACGHRADIGWCQGYLRCGLQVIGAHMVGPDAPEIMQGVAIAIKAGATKAVFDSTVCPHPHYTCW